jgi:hypothetical protein
MAADFWLAHLQYLDKVANTNFTIRDQVQQTKPDRVRERPKQVMQGSRSPSLWHVWIITHQP